MLCKFSNRIAVSTCRFFLSIATIIFFLMTIFVNVYASDWKVETGNWSYYDNWLGGEPDEDEPAYINNGGTATISELGECCHGLYLGGANEGHVDMEEGFIEVKREIVVGIVNEASFSQSAGTVNIIYDEELFGFLYLGYFSQLGGYAGTYNLYGGVFNPWSIYVGYDGNGLFNQTGGTVLLNYAGEGITLGNNESAFGYYNLSGTGELYAYGESIGVREGGSGTFNHSSGLNSVYEMDINDGFYNLSNVGIIEANNVKVFNGTFSHSGGTNNIEQTLYIDASAFDESAHYEMTNGVLNAESVDIRGAGEASFHQSGGINTISSRLSIGHTSAN